MVDDVIYIYIKKKHSMDREWFFFFNQANPREKKDEPQFAADVLSSFVDVLFNEGPVSSQDTSKVEIDGEKKQVL